MFPLQGSQWFKRYGQANQRTSHRQKKRPNRRPELEILEDRSLLSANFPLTTSSWSDIGPAPITNGQVPGSLAASGRIAGIATDPTNASVIYAASAGGGVWKTVDDGVNWTPLTDTQQSLSMGAIAIAPSNHNILYAGTGEANNSADSNYGVGILRTTDAGATWTLAQGPGNIFANNGLTTSKIAVDPTNANIVYAAMGNIGENKVFTSGTGIYKSIDGGVTWANTTASIDSIDSYSDVVIDPTSSSVLYMAVGPFFGANASGIYKSTNAGASWSLVYNGTGGANLGRISLAIAPSLTSTIYASIAGNTGNTGSGLSLLVASTNSGGSWTVRSGTPNYMGAQGWYDQWIAVDPANAGTVFAGGAAGSGAVIESTNSGTSWSSIGTNGAGNTGPHADHHAVAFDANGKLVEGDDGGVWRLTTATIGSIAWADLNGTAGANALNTIQFEGIAQSPTNAAIALGGSQDNGTERFTDSIGWTLTDGGDGGIVRFSSTNSNLVYHVAPIGSFGATNYFRKSTNAGVTWTSNTTGLPSSGPDEHPPNTGAQDPDQSTNFYPPFVIDPSNDQRLVLGSSDLYLTSNGAASWTNLTNGKPGWSSTSPADAVAISKTNSGNTIYAAKGGSFASSSTIFVSSDGGATWNTRNLPGGSGRVNDIQIDPTNDQIAYAVVSTFGGGRAFRTTNRGVSWTDISGNLPALPAWSIRIDGNQANTLYVGADNGVYLTTDLGVTWTRMASGLPNVQVFDLDFNATTHTLAAGTHGRGMWEILTQAAAITNVTSTTADGAYGAGTVIPITITFDAAVSVTGTPTLTLNSGGTASYSSGTGTSTLTFSYTVAAGENSPDLNYTSTSALAGTIKDANGNFASNTLPATGGAGSLGSNKNIVIDTVAPTVVHYYVLFGTQKYDLVGSTRFDLPWQISGVQVVFSEPIAAGDIGSLTGLATTGFSGLGTNTLTWSITAVSQGIFSTAILASGGHAVKDAAGNALQDGVDYSQLVRVLWGDVNDDHAVSSADMVLAQLAASGPYNIFADTNGDGVVNSLDVLAVRRRLGTSL